MRTLLHHIPLYCMALLSRGIKSTLGFVISSQSSSVRMTKPTSSSSLSTSTTTVNEFQVYPSLQHIADDYDVYLLDMWGVMHDGIVAYDGVLQVVQELKKRNKEMIILSNSSKRQDNSIKMLKKLGFDHTDFSKIITSGEVAHHLLQYLVVIACFYY